MTASGVQLSYEAIRCLVRQVRPVLSSQIKRKRPQIGDKWHLEEVFLKINGVQQSFMESGRSASAVVDILVQLCVAKTSRILDSST